MQSRVISRLSRATLGLARSTTPGLRQGVQVQRGTRATQVSLQASRWVSVAASGGFSYPGPRKLSEIVKLQLLNKHGSERVREIWSEYHRDHKTAIGEVFTAEEFGILKQRTQRCKHFVLPVPRYGAI